MTARLTALGFTLVELMVVVAIISILAALAVPAYRTFVVRTRAAEGVSFVAPYKTYLTEYILANGHAPPADEDYYSQGGPVAVTRVNWSIGRGAIEVWYGPGAGVELNGTILWLIPNQSAGSISWICRGHSGAGGAGWYLDPRYLPASCR
ncbi:pilin [uncultured Thiodictyon sp.]|jgi:type IV pilus assembly protein PilA|uniref:pilin n=1 Tax=uncultured Thiodictyon sp. TaxID=1846217 RepID=UPI0025D9E4E1|nr:pilin [uncultured Thiodictyon sp.]